MIYGLTSYYCNTRSATAQKRLDTRTMPGQCRPIDKRNPVTRETISGGAAMLASDKDITHWINRKGRAVVTSHIILIHWTPDGVCGYGNCWGPSLFLTCISNQTRRATRECKRCVWRPECKSCKTCECGKEEQEEVMADEDTVGYAVLQTIYIAADNDT